MRVASFIHSSALIAAALLTVAATSPARAQGKMGAFNVCYESRAMPGAVVMRLNLVVVTPKRTMSGEVTMTQAINPPLDVKLPVRGSYRNVAKGRHVANLASPKRPGRHISITMTAAANWKAAAASYSLWLDSPKPPRKGRVALHQLPCK